MTDNNDILTVEQAEIKIREIVEFGYISRSIHFSERMEQRGYDDNDLHLVLSKGEVKQPPEFSQEYNNWVCKVEGMVVEGDIAVVVTAILSHNELYCITIRPK